MQQLKLGIAVFWYPGRIVAIQYACHHNCRSSMCNHLENKLIHQREPASPRTHWMLLSHLWKRDEKSFQMLDRGARGVLFQIFVFVRFEYFGLFGNITSPALYAGNFREGEWHLTYSLTPCSTSSKRCISSARHSELGTEGCDENITIATCW